MYKIYLSGQMFDDFPVMEHLCAAEQLGYDGVQLRSTHVNPSTPPSEKDNIKAFLQEKRLPVNALSCFVGNYGLYEDDKCETSYDTLKSFVDLAVEFESPLIRVWPGWQDSASAPNEVWQQAAKWMRRSAEYASQKGIGLAMEMHHGTLLDTADSAVRLIEMIDHDHVGVIFDAVNLYQVPSEYGPEATLKLKGIIFDVHIKDIVILAGNYSPYAFAYSYYASHIGRFTKVIPPTLKQERYYCHRRINHGGVDWHAVITGLQQIGYAGTITVESVRENNLSLPEGYDLANVCLTDVKELFHDYREQDKEKI